MIEALWSVDFSSNFGLQGSGVVVLETGRALGGDSSMMYVGNYAVSHDGILNGELHVTTYSRPSNMQSVVGLDNFHLLISGKADALAMTLTGKVREDPARTISISARRRAELP